MKELYQKYKGQEITFKNYSGIIAGYTQEKLILATREEPVAKFKKLDKGSYIDKEYTHEMWNYIYTNEATIDKYLGVKGAYEDEKLV